MRASRRMHEVLVAASDGTFARDIRLHQSTGLSVLAADGDYRASIGRRYGSTDRPEDLVNWNSETSAAEVCESAGSMLRADYVEAGQMPRIVPTAQLLSTMLEPSSGSQHTQNLPLSAPQKERAQVKALTAQVAELQVLRAEFNRRFPAAGAYSGSYWNEADWASQCT